MVQNELERVFKEYFTTGYLAVDINTKFALISMICYITEHLKKKKPDVTYYQIVYKLAHPEGIPDDNIKGFAIMCEDFAYGCKEFPTFNINPKEMPKTIRDIFHKWCPF